MLALSDSANDTDFGLLEGQLLKVEAFIKRLKKDDEDEPEPICDELTAFVRKFRNKVDLLGLKNKRTTKEFDKLFMSFGYSLGDKKMDVTPDDKKAGKEENWKIIEMWKALVNFRANLIQAKKQYAEQLKRLEAERKKAAQLAARQQAKAARRNKDKKGDGKDLLAQMEAARSGSVSDIIARAKARSGGNSVGGTPRPGGTPRAADSPRPADSPGQPTGKRRGVRRGVRRKKPPTD